MRRPLALVAGRAYSDDLVVWSLSRGMVGAVGWLESVVVGGVRDAGGLQNLEWEETSMKSCEVEMRLGWEEEVVMRGTVMRGSTGVALVGGCVLLYGSREACLGGGAGVNGRRAGHADGVRAAICCGSRGCWLVFS